MSKNIELVCHDCTQLIANGEIDGASQDWNLDAALDTQEHNDVVLVTGEKYFSYEDCASCHSTLPGYRHAAFIEEKAHVSA